MNSDISAFLEKLKENYFDKAVWGIFADYLDENGIDGGDILRNFDMWKAYEDSATSFVHKRKYHHDMSLDYGDVYSFYYCDRPFIEEVCIQKGLSSCGMGDILWSLEWGRSINENDKKLVSPYMIKAPSYFLCEYCQEEKPSKGSSNGFCATCIRSMEKDDQEYLDCQASERAWMFRFEQ